MYPAKHVPRFTGDAMKAAGGTRRASLALCLAWLVLGHLDVEVNAAALSSVSIIDPARSIMAFNWHYPFKSVPERTDDVNLDPNCFSNHVIDISRERYVVWRGKQGRRFPRVNPYEPSLYIRIEHSIDDGIAVLSHDEAVLSAKIKSWCVPSVLPLGCDNEAIWVVLPLSYFDGNAIAGQIRHRLSFPNLPAVSDGLLRLPKGPEKEEQTNPAYDQTNYAYEQQRVSPTRHLLLGLQVVVGALAVAAGIYGFSKASKVRQKSFVGMGTDGYVLISISCGVTGGVLALLSMLQLISFYSLPSVPS